MTMTSSRFQYNFWFDFNVFINFNWIQQANRIRIAAEKKNRKINSKTKTNMMQTILFEDFYSIISADTFFN